MNYSIIPEFSDLQRTLFLTKKYDVNLEYNDFTSPLVYEDEAEIEKRILGYKSLGRDMSLDTMHGAFLGVDIAASDPVFRNRSRELCLKSMEIGSRLGVKGVVFHTGLIGQLRLSYYLDNWLKEAVLFFTEICKKYPDITVYMENSFEQSPDIFVRLMEKMQEVDNFSLCFDYGHAVLTSTPVDMWMGKLAKYIGHMHLNDNDLVDDLHLIPGTGKIDFEEYFQLVKKYKIDVGVLLEVLGDDKVEASILAIRNLQRTDLN